jgi:hypothetical protein
MRKEQRLTYWQGLVQEQARSGIKAAAFCRHHEINLQRFYSWRQRFKAESDANNVPGAFLELVPSSKIRESGIRIRLSEKLSIELDRGFDPRTLRNAIDALCGKELCYR